jgi:hypothetical protein
MSVQLPSFVTISFLQEVFNKNFAAKKTLTIKQFHGEWATKKGDNYASEMYRIFVDFELNGEIMRKPILLKVNKALR